MTEQDSVENTHKISYKNGKVMKTVKSCLCEMETFISITKRFLHYEIPSD